jgi:hypothetical protein
MSTSIDLLPTVSAARPRSSRARWAASLALATSALLVASPVFAAPRPPDGERPLTASQQSALPIEVTWLTSGGSPAPDDVVQRAVDPDSDGPNGPSGNVSAETTSEHGGMPIPWDEYVSNYGCVMVEPDPGDHLGTNCIDEGWLSTDGTVYVHTTVPADTTVYLSANPEVAGYGSGGYPYHTDSELDSSDTSSYEFTTRAFDILPAVTYFITAVAVDDQGSLSWRYGTATVPHTALVVIEKLTVLNDGDEGSLNRGEISFRFGVDDELIFELPEDKYDDGDWFNVPAFSYVSGSPASVDVWVAATEDDPGKCVVEATGDVDDYQDGGGCHFAKAHETFDVTAASPSFDFEFTSPDEHLRVKVEGSVELLIGG